MLSYDPKTDPFSEIDHRTDVTPKPLEYVPPPSLGLRAFRILEAFFEEFNNVIRDLAARHTRSK